MVLPFTAALLPAAAAAASHVPLALGVDLLLLPPLQPLAVLLPLPPLLLLPPRNSPPVAAATAAAAACSTAGFLGVQLPLPRGVSDAAAAAGGGGGTTRAGGGVAAAVAVGVRLSAAA